METKGFFASLFDFSFTSLITTKIIKGVYVLFVVLIGLGYVVTIISGFSDSAGSGLVALIFGALVSLVAVIYSRMLLELFIAVFRIMETNTSIAATNEEIAAQGRGGAPVGPAFDKPTPIA